MFFPYAKGELNLLRGYGDTYAQKCRHTDGQTDRQDLKPVGVDIAIYN